MKRVAVDLGHGPIKLLEVVSDVIDGRGPVELTLNDQPRAVIINIEDWRDLTWPL